MGLCSREGVLGAMEGELVGRKEEGEAGKEAVGRVGRQGGEAGRRVG
jgi:hypothetical protein